MGGTSLRTVALVPLLLVACGGDATPTAVAPAPPPPAVPAVIDAGAVAAKAPDAGVPSLRAQGAEADDGATAVDALPPGSPHLEAFDDGAFHHAAWSADGRLLALSELSSVVVAAGDAVKLRIHVDQSAPSVRFDGNALSVLGVRTITRYDLESGERIDASPPPPRSGRAPLRFDIEGGGTIEIADTTTSRTTVEQRPSFFNDDTGSHRYMAPFDVTQRTTRYSVTRTSKNGAKVTRDIYTTSCTEAVQQVDDDAR